MKQKTQRKQMLVILCSMTLILMNILCSLMPCVEGIVKASEITSISNPHISEDGVSTWDCIYFGNYWQNDTNGDGVVNKNDSKEPIKWRVLSVNGDDLFLLADCNLDCQRYNSTSTKVTWENCTLRSWLNGYGNNNNADGVDYSDDNFIDSAFSESEQTALIYTNVINDNGNDTMDKIYLLSETEAFNASYGFVPDTKLSSDTHIAVNTKYAKAQGLTTYYSYSNAGSGDWWIRSYYTIDNRGRGPWLGSSRAGVRPALHINLSLSEHWSYAGTLSAIKGHAEDNRYINDSEAAHLPREINGYRFTLTSLYCGDGITYFGAKVENLSNESKDFQVVNIIFYNEKMEEIGGIAGCFSSIKIGASTYINSSATAEYFAYAYDWSIEFPKETSSSSTPSPMPSITPSGAPDVICSTQPPITESPSVSSVPSITPPDRPPVICSTQPPSMDNANSSPISSISPSILPITSNPSTPISPSAGASSMSSTSSAPSIVPSIPIESSMPSSDVSSIPSESSVPNMPYPSVSTIPNASAAPSQPSASASTMPNTSADTGTASPSAPSKPTPSPNTQISAEEREKNELQLNKNTNWGWNGNFLTVKWGKLKNASGYDIYAAVCSTSFNKVTLNVKNKNKTTAVIKRVEGKKVSKKNTYKVRVCAYRIVNGKKQYIGKTNDMHVAGSKDNKFTNAKSIKTEKKKYVLRKNKSVKIMAEIVKQSKKKKLLPAGHGAKLKYTSSDKTVAAVTKSGVVRAKKHGSCVIYIHALNGVNKQITVTVK